MIVTYVLPLILGMSYDAKTSKPGIDLFNKSYTNDPLKTVFDKVTGVYIISESAKSSQEHMEVKGDLAMKIKSGMIDLDGKGSYLRQRNTAETQIEVLTYMKYMSAAYALPDNAKPWDDWLDYTPQQLGTHYASSITYGAEMIASVRYIAHDSSDLDDIKAEITGSLKAKGDAVDLTIDGKLDKLNKKLESKASIEISYYGTVPLFNVANTVDGINDLIRNFKAHLESANLINGIPMEVKLSPLTNLGKGAEKFKYKENTDLTNSFNKVEEQVDDLRNARSSLTSFVKTLPYTLTKKNEDDISKLLARIDKILAVAYDVLWKLDQNGPKTQLKPIDAAYKEGGAPKKKKFTREVNYLKEDLLAGMSFEDATSASYVQWGHNNCTGERSQTLYKGYTLGSTVAVGSGGPYRYLCVPDDAKHTYDLYKDCTTKSLIDGVAYSTINKNSNPFEGDQAEVISGKGVPCSLCFLKDDSDVSVIAARQKCPITWNTMYSGYYMSAKKTDGGTSEYICVDGHPSAPYALADTKTNRSPLALTTIENTHNILPEQYDDGDIIKCSVCSISSDKILL